MQLQPNPSSEFPLSPDATNLVLDLLDTPSIASFSLVNRCCSILARRSLWKNLRIPNDTALTRLTGLETTATTRDGSQTTTPSPWLTLVRSLEISYTVWSADTTDWDALSILMDELKDNVRRISLLGPANTVDHEKSTSQYLSTILSKQTRAVECLFGMGTSYPRLRSVNIDAVWPHVEGSVNWMMVDHSHKSPVERVFWTCAAPNLCHFAPGLSPSFEFIRPIIEQHASTLESLSICLYDESSLPNTETMTNFQASRLRRLSWCFSRKPSIQLMRTLNPDNNTLRGLATLLNSRSVSRTLTMLDVQSSGSLRTLILAISQCKLLTNLSFSPGPMVVPFGHSHHVVTPQYASGDWAPLVTSPLSRLKYLRLVRVTPYRDGQIQLALTDPTNDDLVRFLRQATPSLVELTLDGCPALFPRTPDPQILDSILAQLSPSMKRLTVTHPTIRIVHEQKSSRGRKLTSPQQSGAVGSNFNNRDAPFISRQEIRQLTLDLPPRSNISLVPLFAPNLEELDIPVARVDMGDLEALKSSAKLKRLVVGGSGDNGYFYMLGRMQWRKESGEWTMVEGADVEIDEME